MNEETRHIDGDVSVGRNVAIGGNTMVQGGAIVKHGLRVEGWLDAPNIKGVNKGIFLTENDLRTTYPVPQDGWFAGVGTSSPFAAYVGMGGQWVATGGTITITVDASSLPVIEDATLQAEIDELRADLTTEEEARMTSDGLISTNMRNRLFVNVTELFELQAPTTLAQAIVAISMLPAAKRTLYQKPGLVITFNAGPLRWQMWQYTGGNFASELSWVLLHDETGTLVVTGTDLRSELEPLPFRITGNTGGVDSIYVNGVQQAVTEEMTLTPGQYTIGIRLPLEHIDATRFPNNLFSGCEYDTLTLPSGMTTLNMSNQTNSKIAKIVVPATVSLIEGNSLATSDTQQLEFLGLPPAINDKNGVGSMSKIVLPREYLTNYLCDSDWQEVINKIKSDGGVVALSDGTIYGQSSEVSLSYIHEQASPSDTWVIGHKLDRYPSVTVVDSSNNLVTGAVTYDSANQLTISFNGSLSGKAYLN